MMLLDILWPSNPRFIWPNLNVASIWCPKCRQGFAWPMFGDTVAQCLLCGHIEGFFVHAGGRPGTGPWQLPALILKLKGPEWQCPVYV